MANRLRNIRSPFSVNYEVTLVCNLKCGFCFACAHSKFGHPSLEHVKRIIDELSKSEVFEIRLFGGEFFCHPEWDLIIEYIYDKGIFMTFVSNGTLIDQKKVDILKKFQIKGGAISIHGPADVHDSITGMEGSYERALRGLSTCLDNGINITVLTTLTRNNKDRLSELFVDLESRSLIRPQLSYGISRLCPFGRASKDWDDSKLSLSDYQNAFAFLEELTKKYDIEVAFGDAIPLCLIDKKYHHLIQGCWQGTGFGHVSVKGDVRGCATAIGSYGNLLEKRLDKIWQGEEIKDFRKAEWLPSGCRQCKEFCGGGCSASRPGDQMYSPDEFLEVK